MRLTQILQQQHLGRMIKRHWYVQSKKKVYNLNSDEELNKLGIPIEDALSFLQPKEVHPRINIEVNFPHDKRVTVLPKHDKICYTYSDSSLFIEGLAQAKVLLKTISLSDRLPEKLEELSKDVSENINNKVLRIIKTSTLFDSHQEKLPKKKHPEKLMWVYARDYGITPIRKTHNLCYKLLNLCELVSDIEVFNNRGISLNAITQTNFEKDSELLQFKSTNDIMITSNVPLLPICEKKTHCIKELPDIYPCHSVIGMSEKNNYILENHYPITSNFSKHHIHTIFIYFDIAVMKNITEEPIKEDQILARSLSQCFNTAASYAKQRFGDNVKDLPEPVTVQCIHCDGQKFHFSVFQLNTLNLDTVDGLMNYWWSIPRINLYDKSSYEIGKPIIEGYNPEVFKKILAFYKNV